MEVLRDVRKLKSPETRLVPGEIGLNIRTFASPKVGQDQVYGGVSVFCLACRTRCKCSMETSRNKVKSPIW